MLPGSLSGAWPVLITPYDDRLCLDRPAYRALLEWYIAKGVGGLYANCLSSEMYALAPEERLQVAADAAAVSAGRVPVAATGNLGRAGEPGDLGEHIAFCRRVAGAGADVVMLVVPQFHDNDADLEAYYLALADAVDAPLGLYECPVPRRYHLGVELVRKLAHTGRFVAYKETSCDLSKIRALQAAVAGTPLVLLQANTPYLLQAVQAGAPGTMSIATNWVPELVAAVVAKGRAGDPDAARLHQHLCVMEMVERAVHPLGVKYLLAKRGLPIITNARNASPLPAEVYAALDACAAAWFDKNGELAAPVHMKEVAT
jgi:4-hydroxy-tetrahydrodipicolinate synthase